MWGWWFWLHGSGSELESGNPAICLLRFGAFYFSHTAELHPECLNAQPTSESFNQDNFWLCPSEALVSHRRQHSVFKHAIGLDTLNCPKLQTLNLATTKKTKERLLTVADLIRPMTRVTILVLYYPKGHVPK